MINVYVVLISIALTARQLHCKSVEGYLCYMLFTHENGICVELEEELKCRNTTIDNDCWWTDANDNRLITCQFWNKEEYEQRFAMCEQFLERELPITTAVGSSRYSSITEMATDSTWTTTSTERTTESPSRVELTASASTTVTSSQTTHSQSTDPITLITDPIILITDPIIPITDPIMLITDPPITRTDQSHSQDIPAVDGTPEDYFPAADISANDVIDDDSRRRSRTILAVHLTIVSLVSLALIVGAIVWHWQLKRSMAATAKAHKATAATKLPPQPQPPPPPAPLTLVSAEHTSDTARTKGRWTTVSDQVSEDSSWMQLDDTTQRGESTTVDL